MTRLTSSELSNTIIIWFTVVVISSLLFSLVPYWPTQIDKQLPLTRENFDMRVYWQGAQWLQRGEPPYRGIIFDHEIKNQVVNSGGVPFVAEAYPQLAMMYFTVPALFTDNFFTYQGLFFIWNSLWFLGLLIIVRKLLKLLKKESYRLYWLLLPSFLFFTFNRYDIFPACLVLWALLMLLEKKFNWGFVLLGLSVLAKLYPLILLPIFLLYVKQNDGSLTKALGLLAVTILAPLSVFIIWTGWLPSLAPYFIHFAQSTHASLLSLIQPLLPTTFLKALLRNLFTLIQITIPLFLFFLLIIPNKLSRRLINEPLQIIKWIALTILLFIIFSPFYSNQWVLWVIPLLILIIPTSFIWLILIHDLVNYIHYPMISVFFSIIYTLDHQLITISLLTPFNALYYTALWVHLMILLTIAGWLIKKLWKRLKLHLKPIKLSPRL
ncbi:MAG: glycosyltransferase 87 family protein [Patescibacteria group bacterium]